MAHVGFGDLLQRAEDLSSGLDTNFELPHVQKSFQQLLDAGQKLCSKTSQQQDDMQVKASLLLCTQGQDIPKVSEKIKVIASTAESSSQLQDIDIEGYLQAEHENAVLGAVERQKTICFSDLNQQLWKGITSSWETEKQSIIKKLVGSNVNVNLAQNLSRNNEIFDSIENSQGVRSNLHPLELAYAEKVMDFTENLRNGISSVSLGNSFEMTMSKMKQTDLILIWKMVNHIAASGDLDSTPGQHESMFFIARAQNYLETAFRDYMQSSVYSIPKASEMGGAPDTLNLVKSFLKISPSLTQSCGEEKCDGLSLWAVVFYCLRCGDLDMVGKIVQAYEHILPDFSMWINEYIQRDRNLSASTRASMKVHFKHTVQSSSDLYKIAVYCIIGKFDFIDESKLIIKCTEDYLWFKLSQVNLGPVTDKSDELSLNKLQHLISSVYGENHFHATENPWLYFKVLFLTHQFEIALEFLSRFEFLLVHAVHIALVLYTNGQLHISEVQNKLLKEEYDKNSQCTSSELNITKLVMLYTQRFELTNPAVAICYYYLMRDIKVEGHSVFENCLCELVQETAEYDMLLGKLISDGSRKNGLIDKYFSDTKTIISKIAMLTENQGLYEDAVLLHDLAGNADKALNLLNRLLTTTCSKNDINQPDRPRIKKMALDIAHRYQKQNVENSSSLLSTFHLLLDLVAFFDLYHAGRHEQALDILRELQIVPFDTEEVTDVAQKFKLHSDEIRQNMSPLLLAAMNLLMKRSHSALSKEKRFLKQSARALIVFAGMLPYHLPADTTSALVKLEVQMK